MEGRREQSTAEILHSANNQQPGCRVVFSSDTDKRTPNKQATRGGKLSTINMSSGVLICWYCWHLPLHSQHGAILDINIIARMLTGEAKCHYNHQQWLVIIIVPLLHFTQKCNFYLIACYRKSVHESVVKLAKYKTISMSPSPQSM